jgi:hypothetical protein
MGNVVNFYMDDSGTGIRITNQVSGQSTAMIGLRLAGFALRRFDIAATPFLDYHDIV